MTQVKDAPASKTETMKSKGQAPQVASSAPMSRESNPLTFMHRFAEEMDHLFEDFGIRLPSLARRGRNLLGRQAEIMAAEWYPKIDIQERNGQFLVRADLPGMTRDNIQVELTDDSLVIQGERKQEQKEEREGYAYSECSYGRFYRAIPLPEGVDPSKATAEFRNGVLEVSMPEPQRPEAKARRVEIQEKKCAVLQHPKGAV